MFPQVSHDARSPAQDLDYFLRRAEQETIAQIRASNVTVAQRHGAMAEAYSKRARAMLSGTSGL